VEAGAQTHEADLVAPFHAPGLAGLVERDRNRRRGRARISLDVVEDLRIWQIERPLDRLIDTQVGLVRDEQVGILHAHAMLRAELSRLRRRRPAQARPRDH
jgi:hypothetical protein